MTYASGTSVGVNQTIHDIERVLERYGAEGFGFAKAAYRVQVEFMAQNRRVRITTDMPEGTEDEFLYTETRRVKRSKESIQKLVEQARKERWRAILLVLKAKLEAVESGIAEFEEEFLAHIVLPDGTTAGQWMRPQIAEAYSKGTMPTMLPALGPGPS
jgi:hypothetical protein